MTHSFPTRRPSGLAARPAVGEEHRRARRAGADRRCDAARPGARAVARLVARRWPRLRPRAVGREHRGSRPEEHTSELQSLMRISYAVFCLTKKTPDRL